MAAGQPAGTPHSKFAEASAAYALLLVALVSCLTPGSMAAEYYVNLIDGAGEALLGPAGHRLLLGASMHMHAFMHCARAICASRRMRGRLQSCLTHTLFIITYMCTPDS